MTDCKRNSNSPWAESHNICISKYIAYVGPFSYPANNANSLRVSGLSSALTAAGYTVLIGSGQRDDQVNSKDMKVEQSIQLLNLQELPDPTWPKLLRVIRGLTWGGKTLQWLKTLRHKPSAVIVYGAHLGYLMRLIPWCRSAKIPLIVDMVEWYQPSHLSGGAFGPFALASEVSTRLLVPKAGKVITISRFLEKYYTRKECFTLRIPPIFNVKSVPNVTKVRKSKPLTLAYVGVPHKKDLLNNAIEAVLRLDETGSLIQFVIAGPKVEDILRMRAMKSRCFQKLPGSIKSLGHITHQHAMDAVRQADFTILLRPPLRYSNAGFPSKVVESLLLETPVICNYTSDLQDYINDGVEGLICADYTPEACVIVLKRALKLSNEEIDNMSKSARACAEKYFDYRRYVESIVNFLKFE